MNPPNTHSTILPRPFNTNRPSRSAQVPRKKKARRDRRPKRAVNWRSSSKPGTVQKQREILDLLSLTFEGLTVAEIGRGLGISRQLALYHLKKMAALGMLIMQLEPCVGNGGLQFRMWDEQALIMHYAAAA